MSHDFTPLEIARFWSMVNVRSTRDCWEWKRGKCSHGYGHFKIKSRAVRTHTISFKLFGKKIPKGLVLDHICRNRLCVNPNHLRAVTQAQNTLENSRSASALNKAKTHCIHGHEFNLENTKITRTEEGRLRRECRACIKNSNRRTYEKTKARKALADIERILK